MKRDKFYLWHGYGIKREMPPDNRAMQAVKFILICIILCIFFLPILIFLLY